ncbi:MAG: UpxY family transcription antiterminator [Saprospiraceae bacterium]|nr:UpxY family transcription antiterminator [Candidatus Vicinibacter affinis]MBP6172211.1 UpxY family transcription antiterminator [Saprospiraceae bacterium]MBK6571626.1 UpxY family transcription antiterminator [Candidatus Vicinibacter affinis]MBK6822917.1 UpxY family transcription antiterminator [Candidatus Vicinibacter affinis]MBK7305359.1 UpxY family transcription antiterminator [Candidatus Vicinibacter affinis]
MLNWKVIYVQSRYEFKAEQQFKKLCINYYLHTTQVSKVWSDRIKKQTISAFPSYISVHNDTWDCNDVFQAKGVMYYVRQYNQDAILSDAEMNLIQTSGPWIVPSTLQSIPRQKGQKVKIIEGLLGGYSGILVNYFGKKNVQLKLENMSLRFLVKMPLEYPQMI